MTNENVKMEMAYHMRSAIKDLPARRPGPSQTEIVERISLVVKKVLEGAKSETGQRQGGMDDLDVIATLKEAESKGVNLREHDDFPFRLAARHGRVGVMRFLYGKKTRPSQDSTVFALIDALNAGYLEAARFAGKMVLGGIPALMRELVEKRIETMELADLLHGAEGKIKALMLEIDMRNKIEGGDDGSP